MNSSDAASAAVAQIIDPAIGQMKEVNDNDSTQNLADVLHQQDAQAAAAAAAAAVQERQNEDQNGENKSGHTRILPREKSRFALDPDLNLNLGGDAHQSDGYGGQILSADCTRCKKPFPNEVNGKLYKLCPHCRDLQRERSRRWQTKTKKKNGACRRCGQAISEEDAGFVLCPTCRIALRTRKANRAAQGKCVHCSGPNDSPNNEFKVCQRCRDNDKLRRTKLEKLGACNRCAKPLLLDDLHNYKVCSRCRNRKKKGGSSDATHHVLSNVETSKQLAAVNQAAAMGLDLHLFNHHLGSDVQQQLQQVLQNSRQQGGKNEFLSPENFVQQLQNAAATSYVANAALRSKANLDDSKIDTSLQQAGQDGDDSKGDEKKFCVHCSNFYDANENPEEENTCFKCSEKADGKKDKNGKSELNNLFLNPEGRK